MGLYSFLSIYIMTFCIVTFNFIPPSPPNRERNGPPSPPKELLAPPSPPNRLSPMDLPGPPSPPTAPGMDRPVTVKSPPRLIPSPPRLEDYNSQDGVGLGT